MKQIIALLLLFFCCFSSFGQKEVPYLAGRINDEAGVLSLEAIQELEHLLKTHEDSTTNQIAVLIINSLEGEILEEYSLRVAETWGLGQKSTDNGVLLLIALNDRKMRIEVGYGLEGYLTDALSNRIIRNEIAPNFRQEDYEAGIKAGVEAIIAAINGSYLVETLSEDFSDLDTFMPWYMRIVIGVVFLLVIAPFTFFAFMTKGCASWFLFLFLIPFYATFPTFIFGTVAAMILLALYFFGFLYFKIFYIRSGPGKKWFNSTATKWAASSSSSGSGWSSSGGSSFSGGGGSFGGGGSSGSW